MVSVRRDSSPSCRSKYSATWTRARFRTAGWRTASKQLRCFQTGIPSPSERTCFSLSACSLVCLHPLERPASPGIAFQSLQTSSTPDLVASCSHYLRSPDLLDHIVHMICWPRSASSSSHPSPDVERIRTVQSLPPPSTLLLSRNAFAFVCHHMGILLLLLGPSSPLSHHLHSFVSSVFQISLPFDPQVHHHRGTPHSPRVSMPTVCGGLTTPQRLSRMHQR